MLTTDYTIIVPQFICDAWDEAKSQYPDLVKIIGRESASIAFNYESLAIELFAYCALYDSHDPDFGVEVVEKLKPESLWIKYVHDRLLQSVDYKMLLPWAATAGVDGCAMAVYCLLDNLSRAVPYPACPMLTDPAELRELFRSAKTMGLTGIDLKSLVDEGIGASEYLKDYAETILAIPADEISKMCREAYEQFKKLLDGLHQSNSAHESLGLTSGSYSSKKKIADALKNSSKLQSIMSLAGKFMSRAMEIRDGVDAKSNNTPDHVDIGDDLGLVMQDELMSLSTDRTDFVSRWTDSSLIQFTTSPADKRSGSIVVMLDSSGSMDGDPEIWAKAVLWAIMAIARRDRRNICVLHYGTKVHERHDFNMSTSDLDIDKWIKCLEYFHSAGGTENVPVFDEGMRVVTQDSQYAGADLVFLHDGGCSSMDQKWVDSYCKKMQQYDVSLFTILINCGSGSIPQEFLTNVTYVGDLANETCMDSLFESL